MGDVEIRVDFSDLNAVLAGYVRRSNNIDTSVISQILATAIDDVIQSQGAAGTQGAWDEFSPTTLDIHPRRIGGMLLQDTGILANIQTSEGGFWGMAASPAEYAHWHVTGTGNMPERDFLAVELEQVSDEIADILTAEIVQ